MVKTLHDCCLACIAKNISSYSRLGHYLSLRHKEILLERTIWHNLLTPTSKNSIVYNLISSTLQRVNLSFSEQVNDDILGRLGESGCLLTSLVIQDCPQVTDKGVATLGRILRTARILKLKKLKQLTGEGFKTIKSRTLEVVNLNRCLNVEDGGIKTLVKNCPNIRSIKISELHKVTDSGIIQMAKALNEKLTELDSSELNQMTSQSTLALAQHCRNLSVASFESCVRLDGSGLMQMAERCSLSSLCLSFCYKVTPQACEVIISLLRARGSLTKLEVMGLSITPLAMEMLASTTSLTALDLCGVPAVNDEMVEMITRAAGGTLANLDISNCQSLTDQSCASIARHCVSLEFLGMRNMKDVTGLKLSKMFQDKERASNFQSITLSGSKNVSSTVIEEIVTKCCNLDTITMAGVKGITDVIPEAIATHCRGIKRVSFRNCDLTDSGVCKVAVKCSQLVMVALAGIHDLTDKSILALAENCPDLRELYISGCAKITKQAVTYLKDCAVGHVYVNHSTPNQPQGLLMAKDLDTGEYRRVDLDWTAAS